MEPSDLLCEVAATLDALGIPYLTTGSMASVAYGEPRFTNDVDVVIRINPGDIDRLCSAFGDEYYLSAAAAREAVARRSQFNLVHPASGLKVDFMVAAPDEFNRSRFERARTIEILPGVEVRFASPEDVILRKLQYYKQGGSDKHLRDIGGILRLCETPIDMRYIEQWADRLDVRNEWDLAQRAP